jgi:hypothetical protein
MRTLKTDKRDWSTKEVAAVVCIVLFLAIQIGVPLVQLFAPRPAHFGWQMFAAIGRRPKFSVVMRDGTTRPVDPSPYLAERRGDLKLEAALPPHLCRILDIAAVQILFPNSQQPQVHTCP